MINMCEVLHVWRNPFISAFFMVHPSIADSFFVRVASVFLFPPFSFRDGGDRRRGAKHARIATLYNRGDRGNDRATIFRSTAIQARSGPFHDEHGRAQTAGSIPLGIKKSSAIQAPRTVEATVRSACLGGNCSRHARSPSALRNVVGLVIPSTTDSFSLLCELVGYSTACSGRCAGIHGGGCVSHALLYGELKRNNATADRQSPRSGNTISKYAGIISRFMIVPANHAAFIEVVLSSDSTLASKAFPKIATMEAWNFPAASRLP